MENNIYMENNKIRLKQSLKLCFENVSLKGKPPRANNQDNLSEPFIRVYFLKPFTAP